MLYGINNFADICFCLFLKIDYDGRLINTVHDC